MKFIYKDKLGKSDKGIKVVRLELDDKKPIDTLRRLILAVRKSVSDAKKAKSEKIAINLKDLSKLESVELSISELGELIAREMLIADYEFAKYKTEPKEGWSFIQEVAFLTTWLPGNQVSRKPGLRLDEFKRGIERGKIIAGEVNKARELANTPGGDMSPLCLAQAAREATRGTPLTKVTVLGVKEMQKLGMGAVLAVGKGSPEEPKFIVVEYWGAGSPKGNPSKGSRPIVLVGKGVTFDTGGLNIKTENHMYTMHLDMSGGAAVIHALALAAKLGVKKNIVALVPAVENMPGGASYRPGDIVKSMSGKTIEILNTDAEGRVILADALTYAKKYNPKIVIDVATLTGAAVMALGERASAIFSRDQELINKTIELSEFAGDYVWPMPLWEEYEAEVVGTYGDVANLGKKGRAGGAIAGAVFLLQFAKDYAKDCKWMHIDMAPTMLATDDEYLAKGAKGSPVKLLLGLISSPSKSLTQI